MTELAQENVTQNVKPNDKELNFRALEQKYQRALNEETSKREAAERALQERSESQSNDDDDDEPYVDKKRLNKTLARFGEQSKQQTQTEIQRAVQSAINDERKQNWMKNNPDFQNVLNEHAETFARLDPELAESILEMPEGFERQKLVYKNIKALGIDKPKIPEQSIQDKVNANRKGAFYQPTNVGNAPYAQVGDFSEAGQKQAYEKLQQLKANMRL